MEELNEIKITKYMYLDENNEEKHYFIGGEIATLIGYQNSTQAIQLNVSEQNKISFKNYLGVKEPKINGRQILINKSGIYELLNKNTKTLSDEAINILKDIDVKIEDKKKEIVPNTEDDDKTIIKEELTTYSYFFDHIYFEYFVGYEIAALLGYKNTTSIIQNNVSKSNQIEFRDYPGIKEPEINPKAILISRDGAIELLIKTRKRISPDVAYILKKFNIETTNRKCLTKEQQTLSTITNVFKTEKFEDQFKIGTYYLDLYFSEYKIVIECDENGHTDRKPWKERERMDYVNEKLEIDDSDWIRFNPDEHDFDISRVIGRIYRKIKEKEYLNKSVNQYTLTGKYLQTFKNVKNASNETNIKINDIYNACLTLRRSAGKYLWLYSKGNNKDIKPLFLATSKAVGQYTLDGDLIKVYKSAADAGRDIDAFQSRHDISRVCNGITSTCHNFLWKYVDENNIPEKIKKYELHLHTEKKIHMYKDNILIDSFHTITEAYKKTSKSRSAITKYINGKSIDRQGYVWKNIFLDVVEEFIPSKKIFVYKDNILINSFSTTIEAANIYKKARSTISRYIENGIDIEGNRWEK